MVMSVSECLCRVNTLKRQFKHLYVVVVVSTGEQIESFNQSYFKYAPDIMLNVKCLFWLSHCYLCGSHSRYGMELGCPTFVPVCDPEMGFEKIVKIAHARGGKSLHSFLKFLTRAQVLNWKVLLITYLLSSVCKQQDIITTMRNEVLSDPSRYISVLFVQLNYFLASHYSGPKLFSAWMHFYEC